MTPPKRIQRKRIKGYRLPSNAVYVGRGSQWGNPFPVADFGRPTAIMLYRGMFDALRTRHPEGYIKFLQPLIGKDLACWCALNDECHADVLLEHLSALETTPNE